MSNTTFERFTDAVRCPHGLSGWTNDKDQLVIQHGDNPEASIVFIETDSSANLTQEFQSALRRTLAWARQACEYEGVTSEPLTSQEERDAYYAFVMDALMPRAEAFAELDTPSSSRRS